jgi:HK97 gp10 family phage protein
VSDFTLRLDRGALGSDGRGLLAIIGTSTHYAPYIEFGTRYMAAQPFLRPALAAAR